MGFLLESGEVGNIGYKQQKEQKGMIAEKWGKLGFLKGLDGHIKENVAQLFENQASFMLNESTTSDSSGSFETVAFPIIRRVFQKLFANEIVSTQALNMPIGRIYFINPKISKRKSDGSHYSPDGAYSNAATTAASAKTQFETYSLYDAFYADAYGDYGTGLFDRTSGKATTLSGTVELSTSITIGDTKYASGYITGVTGAACQRLIGAIGGTAESQEFLDSLAVTTTQALVAPGYTENNIAANGLVPYRMKAQGYGKELVDANGKIAIEIDLTFPGASGVYTAYSSASVSSAITFNFSYNVYSSMEEDSDMAEISFDFEYQTVDVGRPKKLRATYTPELAQDVSAFHSIDVEAELTALLSEQVAMEIDRVILRDLRNGAAWSARWDWNGYTKRSTTGISRKDYNQELVTVINQVSAQIQKATLRGGANWIVVSPEVAAVFNDLEYFHVSNASPEETKFSMGIEKIGALQNRMQVYVDTYAPANTILIGHKGDSLFHSGYVFAPYVPLQLMPAMQNPFNGSRIHILLTRFATKMINNRFYGKVYVDGLRTFGINELR